MDVVSPYISAYIDIASCAEVVFDAHDKWLTTERTVIGRTGDAEHDGADHSATLSLRLKRRHLQDAWFSMGER